MAEFVAANYDEAVDYVPVLASLIITFTDGGIAFEDSVQLDAEWACSMMKAIRHGDSLLHLDGCLPAGSNELRPESKHVFGKQHGLNPIAWRGWLARKPAA